MTTINFNKSDYVDTYIVVEWTIESSDMLEVNRLRQRSGTIYVEQLPPETVCHNVEEAQKRIEDLHAIIDDEKKHM